MRIKYFIITVLVLFTSVSCTKVEIITDSYWIHLVEDFNGNAFKLKLDSFLMGSSLSFSIVDVKDDIPDLTQINSSESDIYLLSPLLSSGISTYSKADGNKLIYYFNNTEDRSTDSDDNLVKIERDRKDSFFEAGELLSKDLESSLILPIIYSVNNKVQREEALSFLEGLNKSGKNIGIISVEVDNSTTESEIRNFFDSDIVKNNEYIVIFANKWKNLCFEISERDRKHIVTSDSWFNSIFSSFILFSIEDDINGMLKKVYYNAKMKNLADITLEGYIYK
ncbi:MAG: hypothetical protein KAH95_13060 [Spirochaetales bacterium]|nr:hypothetical protein [Spirochaetales bacterium]